MDDRDKESLKIMDECGDKNVMQCSELGSVPGTSSYLIMVTMTRM